MVAFLNNRWDWLSGIQTERHHANYTTFPSPNADMPPTMTGEESTFHFSNLGLDAVSKWNSLLVLFCFLLLYFVSALEFWHHSHAHGTQPDTGSSSGSHPARCSGNQGSSNLGEPRSGKRKRPDREEEKDKDDEQNLESAGNSPSSALTAKSRFACLFLRFNPNCYLACAGAHLANYEAVKKHIERKHLNRSDFYCPRCFTFFTCEDEKDEHVRRINSDTPCAEVPGHDVITNAEWKRIFSSNKDDTDRCPRTSKCPEKWIWMWRKMFRGHPQPPLEAVYLKDIVVEARHLLINRDSIQTLLETNSPLNQFAIPDLTIRIYQGLMLEDSRPRPYRVCHDSDRAQGESSNEDAGVLRPVVDQLTLPFEQALLGPGDSLSLLGAVPGQLATDGSVVRTPQASPSSYLPRFSLTPTNADNVMWGPMLTPLLSDSDAAWESGQQVDSGIAPDMLELAPMDLGTTDNFNRDLGFTSEEED